MQRQPTSIGIKNLLGLNLKFCLSRKSLPKDINQTILRMARSIRICHLLQSSGLNPTSHYEKQIYIKNSNWHPPPAPLTIENKITEFEKALKDKQRHLETKYTKRNLSNLTPFQTKILPKLRQNTNIVIKPSGKNLRLVSSKNNFQYISTALVLLTCWASPPQQCTGRCTYVSSGISSLLIE